MLENVISHNESLLGAWSSAAQKKHMTPLQKDPEQQELKTHEAFFEGFVTIKDPMKVSLKGSFWSRTVKMFIQ